MFTWIWSNVLYNPIINIALSLYHLLGDNLGLAIIILAIIFRLVLLPLTKSQTNMTRKMASLKPQLDALQKKYANNKEKLTQEQTKLYKASGYNPLGCLGTFIPQLLIIIVLYQVIRNVAASNTEGIYPFIQQWISGGKEIVINTNFLGLELTNIYSELTTKFSKEGIIFLILAVLAGVSQYITTKFTQLMQNPQAETPKKKEKKKGSQELSPDVLQKNMSSSFNYILPVMTILFAIRMPAFLSLYWVAQSFALIVQYVVLDWDKTKDGVQNLLSAMGRKNKKKDW